MRKLIKTLLFLFAFFLMGSSLSLSAQNKDEAVKSTKKERNHITKGNKFFEEGKFKDAIKEYQAALEENPSSYVSRYNLGLSQIQLGSNPNDTSETAKKILATGMQNMQTIANMGSRRPDLASKANYNLGNVAFNSEDYGKAIDYYKQSLRLNPENDNAIRNLRIAQLRIKDQNQDQNQDQNEDQEQDKQDQQDQKEQQDQQDQQDQQNQQDQQEQNQENQQPQSNLNQQTAEQILNAIENKENQTRSRVAGQNAEKSRQINRNRRNW